LPTFIQFHHRLFSYEQTTVTFYPSQRPHILLAYFMYIISLYYWHSFLAFCLQRFVCFKIKVKWTETAVTPQQRSLALSTSHWALERTKCLWFAATGPSHALWMCWVGFEELTSPHSNSEAWTDWSHRSQMLSDVAGDVAYKNKLHLQQFLGIIWYLIIIIWCRGISKIRSIRKSTKLAAMTCHPINKAVMKRWINTLNRWKRKRPSRVSPEISAIRWRRSLRN